MRKLARAIARANMKAEGVQHMNRRTITIDPKTGAAQRAKSYFAMHWRNYVK